MKLLRAALLLLVISGVSFGATCSALVLNPITGLLDCVGSSSATGTVTSVSFTGGIISVANPTTTPAFTVAMTSGGVVYGASSSTWASSGAMAAGQFMLGGGAGAAPTTSFSIIPLANGGTNCATPYAVNPQTSTYQVLLADFTCSKTISVASGTFTITLVASGGQPVAGSWIRILNYGSGVVTVARSGQNINGATTSHTLAAGSATAPTGIWVQSDGTNYFAQDIVSGAASGVTSVGGLTGVIGVASGIGVSGSNLVFDPSVLSGVFFDVGATNAVVGVNNTFTSSASEGSIKLVTASGANAPSSCDGGVIGVNNVGRFFFCDGTNVQFTPSIAGSGATAPSAPAAGVATWDGTTFLLGTLGTTGSGNIVRATSATLVTPALGAATATSILATGIVDGKAPVTITTGTTATLGAATYQSGYTLNQESTAGTAVTYTLPPTAVGIQQCVKNSDVTGTARTGVLTVAVPTSSYLHLNGVRGTISSNITSGGAAGDAACFVAIDATNWEVYVQVGTWTLH